MINLLDVSLWLTFLICVVGFILYNEIKKVPEKVRNNLFQIEVTKSKALSDVIQNNYEKEITLIQEFGLNQTKQNELVFNRITKGILEQLGSNAGIKDKLNNIEKKLEQVESNTFLKKLSSATEEVIEEWVQYFPVNREYPTILETWVSSLGTIKQIYEDKTVYTNYSFNFKSVCFDHLRLHLLLAKCFLKPRDENDLALVIDREKPVTKDNVVYVDRSEMQFLDRENFGVSKNREDYFLAYYRQNNLGYHKTELEAQKVVYNYRKKWLINNDRVEWLDLWKPDFLTEIY